MKILILGAKGSLGQTFVDLYHDHEVVAWDRQELDITDEEAVMQKISQLKPDLVINCAAYNAVDKAEEQQAVADQINGYAVGFIAKAASEANAIMVHFSTNYVFAGDSQEGYNEDDKPRPQSAYAKSKFLGEIELAENTEKFYLIRTSWLYGKESVTGKSSFVEAMLKLTQEGKEITAIEDEFASPTYVLDLAQATRALIAAQTPFGRASLSEAERDRQKLFGIYHLTNSGSTSWYDWAKEIFSIKNMDASLVAIKRADYPRKAARPQYGTLNNTKFIELRPWTEALREYLENK